MGIQLLTVTLLLLQQTPEDRQFSQQHQITILRAEVEKLRDALADLQASQAKLRLDINRLTRGHLGGIRPRRATEIEDRNSEIYVPWRYLTLPATPR